MSTGDRASAYFEAIRAGDAAAVDALLERDPALLSARMDPPEIADRGFTGLHLAAFLGNAELERLLVERGADPGEKNAHGRTALHVALEYDTSTRELLIELGCEVDVCAAACLGLHERLRDLLDADPGLANDLTTGLSPLGWAAYYCAIESVEMLLAAGARADDGAIVCAAEVNCWTVGRMLIDAGVDPDALVPRREMAALHAAAAQPHTADARPFAKMLLERGADVNVRGKNGWTPLDAAEEARGSYAQAKGEAAAAAKFDPMIALLREHGARRRDESG